jgi:hypothetical protein
VLRDPGRHRILSIALAVGLLSACSDNIPITASPMRTMAAPRSSLTSYSPAPGMITIVDEYDGDGWDGKTLTLDIANRRIEVSDGRVFFLTEEQTYQAQSAFEGTVESDPTAEDLPTIYMDEPRPDDGSGDGCTTADGLPADDCGYGDTYIAAPRGILTPLIVRRVTGVRPQRRSGPRAGQSIHHGMLRRSKASRVKDLPADIAFRTVEEWDMCSNIVNAALPKTLDYKTLRTGFLKEVATSAVAETVNGLAGWALPPGSVAASVFATRIADHAHARIQMGYLAGMWNDYDCANKKVRAGPITVGSGAISGNYIKACGDELWEISFNGPAGPWFGIILNVCRWVPAAH